MLQHYVWQVSHLGQQVVCAAREPIDQLVEANRRYRVVCCMLWTNDRIRMPCGWIRTFRGWISRHSKCQQHIVLWQYSDPNCPFYDCY